MKCCMWSIWEHLWTFYLISFLFAINCVSWNTTCKCNADPCSLSTVLLYGEEGIPPKWHCKCHSPTSGVRSGKDKARIAVKCLFCLCRRHELACSSALPKTHGTRGWLTMQYALRMGGSLLGTQGWEKEGSGPQGLGTENLILWLDTW